MHVKKEGHTSEFLFGIYWWPWKTLIYQKNCWSEPIKNVRILIFTMLFKKIKIKKTPRDIIILYLCTKNYKIQLWYKKIQKDTTLFWEEISACATFHTSCYEQMWSCAIHNSFARCDGDVIHAGHATKAKCQWTWTLSNLIT